MENATVRDRRLSSERKSFSTSRKPAQGRVQAPGMRLQGAVRQVCQSQEKAVSDPDQESRVSEHGDRLAIPGLVRWVSAGLTEGSPAWAPGTRGAS